MTYKIQKWNVRSERVHPILVANTRVDWLALDDAEISRNFPILLEGILQDVFSQRASSAWLFFLARCCLGKVPGRAPFSQLNKGDIIARTGHNLHTYNKQIRKQISGSNKFLIGGREDETDARAVRSDSLARRIV